MPNILIAIPTARYIEPETFLSIYNLQIPQGFNIQFQYFHGYRIDQTRNLIADWVVKGFDYLFAVDHDMVFPPDTLSKLLENDELMCTGVYRQRKPEQILELYDMNYRNYDNSILYGKELQEIGGCGFGCVLIHKSVFVAVGYPWFEYHNTLDFKDTISEDVDFCMKVRNKGIKIYVDKSVVCEHIGDTRYIVQKPTIHDRLRELSNQSLLPEDHINFLLKMKYEYKRNPKVIYDIGACVLHWTKEARKVWKDSRIVVFDAMSEVDVLYREHGLDHVTNTPLYSEDKIYLDFYENLYHPGGNSIYKENQEFSPRASELFDGRNVKKIARTLDSLYDELSIMAPELIKIDAQGAEMDIIKGASKIISENKPDIIFEAQHVEYNFGAKKYEDVKKYLIEEFGYIAVDEEFSKSSLGVDSDYYFIHKDNINNEIATALDFKRVKSETL